MFTLAGAAFVGRLSRGPRMPKPFNFVRWFAVFGLAAIALASVLTSLLVSRLLIADVVRRDARISMEFVQSIAAAEEMEGYFKDGGASEQPPLLEFFNHVSKMPHVLRANVFSTDRRIVWSSDAELIGMRFAHNPELEAALLGRLEVSTDEVRWKPEHMLFDVLESGFVEQYLPVRSDGKVIGVVEIYKDQRALLQSISDSLRVVWLGNLGGAAALYALLCWLVWRGDGARRAHHEQQLECRTLDTLGAIASAVGEGPLAAIRSRAEAGLESASTATRESNEEILFEVERLQRWFRELLTYAPPGDEVAMKAVYDSAPGFDAARRHPWRSPVRRRPLG